SRASITGALAGSRGPVPEKPRKPHLSLCLRVLSRRRTRPDPMVLGVSFQMSSNHAVRLPESFRGGCSFGAGIKADLSRRDGTRTAARNHSAPKPVNAERRLINEVCVLRQLPDPPAQFLDTAGGLV